MLMLATLVSERLDNTLLSVCLVPSLLGARRAHLGRTILVNRRGRTDGDGGQGGVDKKAALTRSHTSKKREAASEPAAVILCFVFGMVLDSRRTLGTTT